MNILFEYLYRDAGNNKKWGEVVFSNKNKLAESYLKERLRNGLIDKEFFVKENSSLPELNFLEIAPELDHEWYEFCSLEETSSPANDAKHRDVTEFFNEILADKSFLLDIKY